MQYYNKAFLAQLEVATKGIDLSAEEQSILKWIAGWDKSTVDRVASIIMKARASKEAVQR